MKQKKWGWIEMKNKPQMTNEITLDQILKVTLDTNSNLMRSIDSIDTKIGIALGFVVLFFINLLIYYKNFDTICQQIIIGIIFLKLLFSIYFLWSAYKTKTVQQGLDLNAIINKINKEKEGYGFTDLIRNYDSVVYQNNCEVIVKKSKNFDKALNFIFLFVVLLLFLFVCNLFGV